MQAFIVVRLNGPLTPTTCSEVEQVLIAHIKPEVLEAFIAVQDERGRLVREPAEAHDVNR